MGALPRLQAVLEAVIDKGLLLLVVVVASIVVYKIFTFFLRRAIFVRITLKKEQPQSTEDVVARKRALTLTGLSQNILKYFLFFLAGYIVLEVLVGRNRLTPLLAGAGVLGLALGLGAQSLLRDVVSGFFILFEGWYGVGDYVHLRAGPFQAEGVVEEVGLRSTSIRDLQGNLHYVPNGQVLGVDKFPRGYQTYTLELVLPKMSVAKIKQIVDKLGKELPRSPFALSAFRNPAVVPHGTDEVLVTVSGNFVPLSEEKAKEAVDRFRKKLEEALGLEELSFSVYPFDERVFSRYKKSLHMR